MTRLLVGTTSPDKLQEIRRVLAGAPVELLGLADVAAGNEPQETGATFARTRAEGLYYARHAGLLTVADDSGLAIDALGDNPGVRSAPLRSSDASYPERFAEITGGWPPPPPHTARFVCAVAVARGGELVYEGTGVVEGEIAPEPCGHAGFGYDPIFYYPPYHRTLAEVRQADSSWAHRGAHSAT